MLLEVSHLQGPKVKSTLLSLYELLSAMLLSLLSLRASLDIPSDVYHSNPNQGASSGHGYVCGKPRKGQRNGDADPGHPVMKAVCYPCI